MNSPGGHSQHDPPNGGQVDPLTGQPSHNPQQPRQPYGWSAQYPPPAAHPPGKSKNSTAALVAVLAGIVAVISVGGTALYLWLADPVEPNAVPVANSSQSHPPATGAAPSTTESSASSRTTEPPARPDVEPTISGWQPVADPRTSIAYDVPPGWKVEEPSVLVGFEDESGPRVAMHAVGTYQDEVCPDVSGSYRGHTGIWGDPMKDVDPREAAEVGARLWATAAAKVPKDDPSVPRPQAKRISLAGGARAWKATITIKPPDGDCSAPEVKFTTVSFTPGDGARAVLFVMYNDQGVPDALPGDVANKIVSTLRPIG